MNGLSLIRLQNSSDRRYAGGMFGSRGVARVESPEFLVINKFQKYLKDLDQLGNPKSMNGLTNSYFLLENMKFPFQFVKCSCFPNLMIDTVWNSKISMPNSLCIQSYVMNQTSLSNYMRGWWSCSSSLSTLGAETSDTLQTKHLDVRRKNPSNIFSPTNGLDREGCRGKTGRSLTLDPFSSSK